MTSEQKQLILPLLDDFWKLNLEERISEKYKDYQDLSSIYIGYYSVLEFAEFSKKAISLIGQTLQSKMFSILPFQYQFQNDFGGGNLKDDLSSFNIYCLNNDFNNAIGFLYRLVYYLVQNGIWDKKQPIDKKEKSDFLNELESKLKLISEQLLRNIEKNRKALEELEIEKGNLIKLVSNKNQELSEIFNLLTSSRTHAEEITRLLTNSTDTNQQLTGLINQQNANLETIKDKLKDEKEIYDSFNKDLKSLKSQYEGEITATNKNNSDFDKLLESVVNKSSTFSDRLIVLNELIGKEGAVKLFSTFNDRKKELEQPVKNWAIVVFGTGLIALVLIIAIFTNFFGCVGGYPTSVDWHYLLINSLKSTPIMIVLYFAIKQYVRERNFQEEYAFRSAIALTVQAYSDIAGTMKEELIANAVDKIYNMPTMMKEKNGIFNFKAKHLNDTLKELNNTIKNIKS